MRYLFAGLTCLALACESSSGRSDAELATDVAVLELPEADATVDSEPADAPPDSAPDALADALPDLAADTSPDAVDATTDILPDAAPAAPLAYLTIAAIPPEMNGSRAAITPTGELPFRLRANRARVDLDVIALPDSGPFGPSDLALSCTADGQPHALPPLLEVRPGHLQVAIDVAHAFPAGAAVVCSATISTSGGTATATYAFDAATLPPALDPFPSTDTWLVLLQRDTWALVVTELPNGTTEMRSTYASNGDGVDDFDAPFYEIGLMPSGDPAAAAAIRAHLLRRVRALVNGIYDLDAEGRPTSAGVDLRLYFQGDAGAPDPADFGRDGQRFSMIALTGDGAPNDQAGSTFGRALIDWNNQDVEDDTVYGLGVWPTAVARTILKNPAGALLLSDMRPALGGTPYGLAEGDALFIGQDVDPGTLPTNYQQRAARYNLLMQFGSLAIAAILSHEIGHSLGLVPFGPPPGGLFAGVETDWTVTLAPDAHIDTAGLNVMQTGASVNWLEAATGDLPRFEPLSWAYLRRQLVVGPAAP